MNGNMVGRVFNNRYQLTDRIGIGGMAEVYRAQDRVLGRVVAVKVMLPQYAADADFTQRFRQEAASAANLQSPYIVNVYDWGHDGDTYFIVMEYVRGSDLKTAITQRGAISQRKVAEIGSQVCQALSVAHNQDIIHRDVKPQNIMVQPDGNVKVMDFGIARAKNSMKQQTSAVLGTAHYISPEQAQGKDLTPASDIYSLGVVMYEAVTGKLPFDGPDSVSVAMKQVSEYPVPPSEINPEVDPGLEQIIMRALEKDPLARFATVSDMKHALNDYLAGRPVNMADATHVMAGAFVPPMADGTQVMPAVDGATGAPTQAARTMKAVDEEALRKKKRNRNIVVALLLIVVVAAIAAAVFLITGNKEGTVPDVTGQSAQAAAVTLKASGYEVGTTTEVYSDTVAAGNVVSTDPSAGTKAAEGTTVNLNVSKGKEQIEVPDLSGMTADQAKAALSKLGLTAKEGTSEYSDSAAEGTVARQDVTAGTKVDAGTTVTYYLSKGSQNVSVPDLSGMTESEAKEALEAVGLTGTAGDSQYSTTVAKGCIISQNPSKSTKVEKGTKVTYVVSLGQQSVPNVVGLTQSEALSELSDFDVHVVDQSSSTVTKGVVIDQKKNSDGSISIYVSTGPASSSSSSSSSSGSSSDSSSSDSSSSSSSGSN